MSVLFTDSVDHERAEDAVEEWGASEDVVKYSDYEKLLEKEKENLILACRDWYFKAKFPNSTKPTEFTYKRLCEMGVFESVEKKEGE